MKLGLTGGMGCGKSTAARLFEQAGFRRLDSDGILRAEVLTDPAVVALVVDHFGRDVLEADGRTLSRPAIAAKVFVDDRERIWLESMLHPRLFARWRTAFAAAPDAPWVVEVPLLFEKQLENWFDYTACVTTTSAIQLARLEERGIPKALAVQRISKQLPLVQKIELSDFVLSNDGTLDFLRAQVDALVARLVPAVVAR